MLIASGLGPNPSHPPAVIPAKAGIQYAGEPAINSIGRGVLGRPVEPGDDGGM
jgi:hypothetical protein